MGSGLRTLLEIAPGLDATLGTHLAWSRSINLLACDLVPPPGSQTLEICLIDPACPEGYTVLQLPDSAGEDSILSLSWTPLGLPTALLVLTTQGCGYVWMQTRQKRDDVDLPVTTDVWFGQLAFRTTAKPVVGEWLISPPAHAWPPIVSLGNISSLESPFLTPAADSQLHWASRGAMTCVVLTEGGRLEVYFRQLGGKWASGPPFTLGVGEEAVLGGDVAASREASMRVAMLVPQQATQALEVAVVNVTGDPTCLSSKGDPLVPLEAAALGGITAQEGHVIVSARFSPGAAGEALLVTQQNETSGAVTLMRYDQPAGAGAAAQWTRVAVAELAGVPHVQSVPPNVLPLACLAPDGSGVFAVVAGHMPAFYKAKGGQLLQFPGLDEAVTAVTASPNSEAWALAFTPLRGSRPVIRIVALENPHSFGEEPSHHFAYRLAWSIVTGGDPWDVVQALRAADAAAAAAAAPRAPVKAEPGVNASGSGGPLVPAALRRLDAALHAQPYGPRSFYGVLVSRVKIAVLRGVTDPIAQTVYMDMWLRGIVLAIKPIFPAVGAQPDGAWQSVPGRKEAMEGWLLFIRQAATYFVQCMRLYVRMKADAPTGAAHMLADVVPAVRLFADINFFGAFVQATTVERVFFHIHGETSSANSQQALRVGPAGTLATNDSSSQRQPHINSILKRLQVIQMHLCKMLNNPPRTRPVSTALEVAVAEQATAAFKGDYSLHYARTCGPMDWTVLAWVFNEGKGPVPPALEARVRELQVTAAEIAECIKVLGLPEPSLEDVMRAGEKLGLRRGLQPFIVPAAGNVACPGTPPVTELRRGYMVAEPPPPLPVNALGPLLGSCLSNGEEERAAKRRRWVADRDAAMGIPADRESLRAAGQLDILSGVKLTASLPPTHVSVDGLSFTADLAPGEGGGAPHFAELGAGERGIEYRTLSKYHSVACPVTFAPWRHVRS